ncbi:MAG TPA: hypothetical protein VHA15_04545 [Burkholderiales bacterium]|jgi:hypothetical protein|nr:hypothetical protein [Burkholderiales bacterium]
MFTRLNFLLGAGLLVLLAFYFAFSYAVLGPLSGIAPGWVKPVAGAAVLISVGLTVQILAMAMSGLAGVASYERGPGPLAIASQAALVCGHGALAFAAAGWLRQGVPPADAGLGLVALLYAAGVALGVVEWRRRDRLPPAREQARP